MQNEIRVSGGEIKDVFYCPHLPETGCKCRKPKPGLIYQACEKYGVDLSLSVMVGDSARDIECARNAGCGATILVRTGNGEKAEKILADKSILPDHVADDLYEAVDWIIAHSNSLKHD
jgi:D-glycero-D-manno-heptose 1,7-bisphosphate phosphatase